MKRRHTNIKIAKYERALCLDAHLCSRILLHVKYKRRTYRQYILVPHGRTHNSNQKHIHLKPEASHFYITLCTLPRSSILKK